MCGRARRPRRSSTERSPEADGIELRLPYQSDPISRAKINAGTMEYIDIHLSHVAQMAWQGFLGKLDIALVEVAGITGTGELIPSSSVGNNKTWIDLADQVILEVNTWHPLELDGMHDIYYGTALPPNRRPSADQPPEDRIGIPHFTCPPEKIVAIVETDAPDRNTAFKPIDETHGAIAGHLVEFLDARGAGGRMPPPLLPLQSGVGNIANAVLAGLGQAQYRGLTAYTEVFQDGMLDLLESGTLRFASATAFSLSPEARRRFAANIAEYKRRILLRPQEISNHPEVIRRLGVIAINGMIEADIYGNVNSTHVMGSAIQNGIGGSGDFARNAYVSIFVTPSTAKGGEIFVHRPDGLPRRPHRARCRGPYHRAGAGGPSRARAAQTGAAASSTGAPTPTIVRCSRTTSTVRSLEAGADRRHTCSRKR